MTAKDHIENWLQRLSEQNGDMDREDICFLMVQARHLIENHPGKAKYRTVEFYSDWIVHTHLDRSERCLSILRDITKVISENWGKTDKDIIEEVSRVIGLSNLRLELIELFKENSLPVDLFTIFDNWKGVASLLTYFLLDKPLIFPDEAKIRHKGLKKIIQETLDLKKPANFWIESISIIGTDSPYWCLQLEGDKRVKLTGLLVIEKF